MCFENAGSFILLTVETCRWLCKRNKTHISEPKFQSKARLCSYEVKTFKRADRIFDTIYNFDENFKREHLQKVKEEYTFCMVYSYQRIEFRMSLSMACSGIT